MINLEYQRPALQRSRERAAKLKTRCRRLSTNGILFRAESVTTAGRWYLVELLQNGEGDIIAECDCAAGRAGVVCHHVAAACDELLETRQGIINEVFEAPEPDSESDPGASTTAAIDERIN